TDSFKWEDADEIGGVAGFWSLLKWPIINLSIGLVGGTLIMLVMMKYLPKVSFFERFMLTEQLKNEPIMERGELGNLVGQGGEALTDLRPAGKALIGGRNVDVTLDGGFAPKGTALRVVGQGMSVIVEIEKV